MGAQAGSEQKSQHYYAILENNNVVKLVVYNKKAEVHMLSDQNGHFSLGHKLVSKTEEEGRKTIFWPSYQL